MGVTVDHRTFVIERQLPGTTAYAFRFWSDFDLKRRWTACHPDWHVLKDQFDFRPGGGEHTIWRMPDGTEQSMQAHYLEVHPAARIVYAYTMAVSGQPISSSLVTVEFTPGPAADTHMTFTEQAVFATRAHGEARQSGTGIGFDRLRDVMLAG